MSRRKLVGFATLALLFLACMVAPSMQHKVAAQQQPTPGYLPGVERIINGNFSQAGASSAEAQNWQHGFPTWGGWGGYTRIAKPGGGSVLSIKADSQLYIAGTYETLVLNQPIGVPTTFTASVRSIGPVKDTPADAPNGPNSPHLGLTMQVKLDLADGTTAWIVDYPNYPTQSTDWHEISVHLEAFQVPQPVVQAHIFIGLIRAVGTVEVQSVSVKEYQRVRGSVAIHFDDGYASQPVMYRKYMKPRKWRANVFPRIDWVSNPNEPGGISWADLAEIYNDGGNIGSHTVTHPDMSKILNGSETQAEYAEWLAAATWVSHKYDIPLPDLKDPIARINWEFDTSDKILNCNLPDGPPIYHMAFPFGSGNLNAFLHYLAGCFFDTQRDASDGGNGRGTHPWRIKVRALTRDMTPDKIHMMNMWSAQDKVCTAWLIHNICDDPSDPYSTSEQNFEFLMRDIEFWGLPVLNNDEFMSEYGDRPDMFQGFQHPVPGRQVNPGRPPIGDRGGPPRRTGN